MKLNQIPNLRTEDFPSEQTWISKLFIQLNPFIQAVNQVLTQNVDFISNIKAVTREYDISSFQPFNFQWPFSDASPLDVRVVKALKGTTLTPTLLMAAWDYDSSGRTISITRLTEINATSVSALSGRYQFTIRATV